MTSTGTTDTYAWVVHTSGSTWDCVYRTPGELESYLRDTFGMTLAAPLPTPKHRLAELRRRADERRSQLGSEPHALSDEERDDFKVIAELQQQALYRWLAEDPETD